MVYSAPYMRCSGSYEARRGDAIHLATEVIHLDARGIQSLAVNFWPAHILDCKIIFPQLDMHALLVDATLTLQSARSVKRVLQNGISA